MADAAAVARRTGLAREVAEELLLDDEARGSVSRVAFADLAGWSLTETGRVEGERRLADELERTGSRAAVDEAHDTRPAQRAVPVHPPPLADPPAAVGRSPPTTTTTRSGTAGCSTSWRPTAGASRPCAPPSPVPSTGSPGATTATPRRSPGPGRPLTWVDGAGVDSCHTVSIQLHEDLLATLGLDRGAVA